MIYKPLNHKINEQNNDNVINFIPNNVYSEKALLSIINNYKRTSIIWPLPNAIKFKPMMTNRDLVLM